MEGMLNRLVAICSPHFILSIMIVNSRLPLKNTPFQGICLGDSGNEVELRSTDSLVCSRGIFAQTIVLACATLKDNVAIMAVRINLVVVAQ